MKIENQRVRVTDGVFKGIEGVISQIDFEISETGELNLRYDGQQTLMFGRYGE